jgi:hypothetical protein
MSKIHRMNAPHFNAFTPSTFRQFRWEQLFDALANALISHFNQPHALVDRDLKLILFT